MFTARPRIILLESVVEVGEWCLDHGRREGTASCGESAVACASGATGSAQRRIGSDDRQAERGNRAAQGVAGAGPSRGKTPGGALPQSRRTQARSEEARPKIGRGAWAARSPRSATAGDDRRGVRSAAAGLLPRIAGAGIWKKSEVVVQYQTEIPASADLPSSSTSIGVPAVVAAGRCRGDTPCRPRTAVGAAASQLGPEAHAAMAILNKELGLSHGKVSRCFEQLFGMHVAPGTSARSVLRTAKRCEPAYEAIRTTVRNSPWVVPDETGWRVGGRPAWLHSFVTESATCYEIAAGSRTRDRRRAVGPGLVGHDDSRRLGAVRLFRLRRSISSACGICGLVARKSFRPPWAARCDCRVRCWNWWTWRSRCVASTKRAAWTPTRWWTRD